jgi:hypothetical protein
MLTVIAVLALALMENTHRRQQAERQEWQRERKDLMDRIQAPSFAEYANKVVREKKLEQPKEEEEKRPEFIS